MQAWSDGTVDGSDSKPVFVMSAYGARLRCGLNIQECSDVFDSDVFDVEG